MLSCISIVTARVFVMLLTSGASPTSRLLEKKPYLEIIFELQSANVLVLRFRRIVTTDEQTASRKRKEQERRYSGHLPHTCRVEHCELCALFRRRLCQYYASRRPIVAHASLVASCVLPQSTNGRFVQDPSVYDCDDELITLRELMCTVAL